MGRRINYQRSASTRTSPNRSTTSQSSEDMEVVEDGILQRCVVGPFRFLLFIFSLALSVRRDERLIAHERSKRKTAKKNTLVIQSRTLGGQSKPTEDSGAGSDSDYLRLHHYQKRIGSAEIRDAFVAEEYFTGLFGKVLAVAILVYACLWLKLWLQRVMVG